ncbi:MAG: dephospho-CoA kinase [Ferruginibacter sp.]
MILKVGLTGGMGSGKSVIAAIFELLGIPVYYADDAAKRLMNQESTLKTQLIEKFGPAIYQEGILNRQYLSSMVFNNEEQLAVLNSIVHPATIKDGEEWMQLQTTSYAVKEAALIFESGAHKHLDYVVGVYAPEPLRMLRVIKRNHISREDVKARMEKQMDDAIKMRLCDYVITNDEQELVIPQVIKLHETFLAM